MAPWVQSQAATQEPAGPAFEDLSGCDPAFGLLLKQIAAMHSSRCEELEELRRQRQKLQNTLPPWQPKAPGGIGEDDVKVGGKKRFMLDIDTGKLKEGCTPTICLDNDEEEIVQRVQSKDSICSEDEKPKLKVRSIWMPPRTRRGSRRYGVRGSSKLLGTVSGTFSEEALIQEEIPNNCARHMSRFILEPSNPKRVAWDLAGMILLAYDVMYIPLSGFDFPPNTFTDAMEWITLLFWTGDVLMSLLTGFVHKGLLVLNPMKILKNYIKTWFLLDLIVVGPDWVFTIMMLTSSEAVNSTGGGGANISKLFRTLRVMRTVRLLRLVKLRRLMMAAKDRITSEFVFIMVNILKLIIMLLLVNHFIASAWYQLGTVVGSPNWLEVHEIESRDRGYKYLTALHWSLTQFTPASMNVQPENSYERAFAITVLIFGLVLFSSFISSITASMTQLRNMQNDKSKQFWLLRRFLAQRNVPAALNFKILRYVEYATSSAKDQVPESRVWVLSTLTPQLRDELRFVTTFSALKSHGMFAYLSRSEEAIMHQMARKALSSVSMAQGDPLFASGESAGQMYFVETGALSYLKDMVIKFTEDVETASPKSRPSQASLESVNPFVTILQDDYLCEVTLWVAEFYHIGAAQAAEMCTMISVDFEGFSEVVLKEETVHMTLSCYGRAFVDHLADLEDAGSIEYSAKEMKLFTQENFQTFDESMNSLMVAPGAKQSGEV